MSSTGLNKFEKIIEKLIIHGECENSYYLNDNNENENENENNLFDKDCELNKFRCNSDIFFEKMYDYSYYVFKVCVHVYKIIGIYLALICLHYIASQLYVNFYVPNTLFSFIFLPFMGMM